MEQGVVSRPWISKRGLNTSTVSGSGPSSSSMQEAGSSAQPTPGPSQAPSPIKRSFSDLGTRQSGPSPIKRLCQNSTPDLLKKELERLVKKEAFLETQVLHLLQALRERFDGERQSIAEEQRRLVERLLELNDTQRKEEEAVKESNNSKLRVVRSEIAELKQKLSLGGLSSTSSVLRTDSSFELGARGLHEEVTNEVLNRTAGREDLGSAARFEHDLSTSQQSASPEHEVQPQPNEESDGEISSSSDILILQAAGLLAELGDAADPARTGHQESGAKDTKGEEPEAIADSTEAVAQQDAEVRQLGQWELRLALKLKDIGTVIEEELQCSICNELLVAAVTINCSHSFCKYCLDQWKKQRAECPMCRMPITAEHRSIILDSLINNLVSHLSIELQQRYKEVLEERAAIEEAASAAAAAAAAQAAAAGPGPATSGPTGVTGGRQGQTAGRGARGYHNYHWQPHPNHPAHPLSHLSGPPPLHAYVHPAHAHPPHAHPPHAHPPHAHPPHAHPPHVHPPHVHPPHVHPPHAHPPHAHPPHAHPPHAHPPLPHPPPLAPIPHVPAHPLPPPPHMVLPAPAHAQASRTAQGQPDSPEHHLRVRRRHGRNILSSGSSSGSSTEEPSDSQSSYSSSAAASSASDRGWYESDYMSAEYDEEENDYEPPYVPGIPGHFYGGYGVCFYCNQRGHWSSGCPVRFGGY